MKRIMMTSHLVEDVVATLMKEHDVLAAGAAIGGDELSEARMLSLMKKHDPEILLVDSSPVTEQVISQAPSLRLIICTRGTPANVDLASCSRRGVAVCNTPARNANAVAEFTLALMLGISRFIPQAMQAICKGEITLSSDQLSCRPENDVIWNHPALVAAPYDMFKGRELLNSVLGIIGLGFIGQLVAKKASALGMNVLIYDPLLCDEKISAAGGRKVTFQELLTEADFISVHAKECSETHHMIDSAAFAQMKRSAYLINTARAGLINYQDLLAALRSGQIAGAALDVFPVEPLADSDPLLSLNNVILTPHIAGASTDVARHHSTMALHSLLQYLQGEALEFQVN